MAEAYKTNYLDKNGKIQTGYIIDGKTYKDDKGTKRVEEGSIVETDDGYYTLTSKGGVKTDFSEKNGYSNNNHSSLSQKIDDLKRKSEILNESLYESKKAQLDNSKKKANDEFLRQAKKEYIRSMESQKNINQLMKSQGIHGGMSESGLIKNQLEHENILNDIMEQKNQYLSNIDMELLKLRNETDYNIASQNAQYDALYLEYAEKNLDRMLNEIWNQKKYDEDIRKYNENMAWNREQEEIRSKQFYDNFNWDQQKFWTDYELNKDQYEHDVEMDNKMYNLNLKKTNTNSSSSNSTYKNLLEDAKIRAQYGDFSGYAAIYGWGQETVDRLETEYKKKNYD